MENNALYINRTSRLVADDFEQQDESWFKPKDYLGKRGFKYFTKDTQFLLAAATLLNPPTKDSENTKVYDGADLGVVIGTNFAIRNVLRQTARVVTEEGAAEISPIQAGNLGVNIPSSQLSIKYGLNAFSLTLTNPYIAGLESIDIACRAIKKQRAEAVMFGACESRESNPQVPLPAGGEGAAIGLISKEKTEHSIEILATQSGRLNNGGSFVIRHLIEKTDKPIALAIVAEELTENQKVQIDKACVASKCEISAVELPKVYDGNGSLAPLLVLGDLLKVHSKTILMAINSYGQYTLVHLRRLT